MQALALPRRRRAIVMEMSSPMERLREFEGGEAERDDLGAGQQIRLAAGAVAVDCLDRGGAGERDVAHGSGEQHRREEIDDEDEQEIFRSGGGVDLWFGGLVHAVRSEGTRTFILGIGGLSSNFS